MRPWFAIGLAAMVAWGHAAAQETGDPIVDTGDAAQEAVDTDPPEDVVDTDIPVVEPVLEASSAGEGGDEAVETTVVAEEVSVAAEPARRKGPDVSAGATGHVKAFAVASFPYDSPILPDQPTGQGFLDARLRLHLDVGEVFHAEVAHAITASIGSAGGVGAGGLIGTGVGLTAPEALPLTWKAFQDDRSTFQLQGRTDRLIFQANLPKTRVVLGRQPISFGNGRFFTPMDLVSPFTPAVIDTEYKPGVDAVRVDVYPTFSSTITAVAAYTGGAGWKDEWTERDVTAALYAQGAIGVTDLGGMYAYVEGDHVVAMTLATGIGPVGLYSDVAVTLPREDLEDEVFVRATLGLDGRPTGTTTVSGELYVQSFGSTDPAELLTILQSERAQRGEIWLSGLLYLSTAITQEITPLVNVSLATITNLTQPSSLVLPSVSWSVASNAELYVGAYIPVGSKPTERTPTADNLLPVTLQSEFGTYPVSAYLQVRTYF